MIRSFNHPILEDERLKKILSYIPEAYFVGGMVRNFLLHKEIKDIDITSATLPEEILARYESVHSIMRIPA